MGTGDPRPALCDSRPSTATAVWFNKLISDEERRASLYAGEIFIYDGLASVKEFAAFTRELVESALAPHDPRYIHQALSPQELAPCLGALKPAFTHHADARRLMVKILEELNVDLDDCHMDVPKLRTAYPQGHLTKGIAYAFPWHRDTWYAGPMAQINWWMPIYPLSSDNCMAFDPLHFAAPVANDSDRFNYYRRNVERKDTAQFITEDPRVQPSALALGEREPAFRLLPPVGGIILFSGAQLHSTITSATCLSRYSIDFRTVNRSDVECGRGAVNVDTRCVGTALRDFRRARDGWAIPEELALAADPIGPAPGEVAVFSPGA